MNIVHRSLIGELDRDAAGRIEQPNLIDRASNRAIANAVTEEHLGLDHALTCMFSVELPGIEPDRKPQFSSVIRGFGYAKLRERTRTT